MTVKLRKWSLTDQDQLIDICNHVDRTYLASRLPFPYTESDAEWWLNMVNHHDGVNGIFRAVVVDDRVVGTISVEQKEDIYQKDGEIGYFLHTDQWSKGIMTEAVKQICDLAFCELDILRITAHLYAPNLPSRRVLEKNGFLLEGTMKNAIVKDDHIFDLCIYGKVK